MPMDSKQLKVLTDLYALNLGYAQRLTADLPRDKWAFQPSPNMNHAAWVIGHLAGTSDFAASMLDGKPSSLPANWNAVYGNVSKALPDASIYADGKTLLETLTKSHERLVQALGQADEALLYQLPVIERLHSRFPMNLSFVIFAMLSHESIHLGQLSAWRRAQGLPSV